MILIGPDRIPADARDDLNPILPWPVFCRDTPEGPQCWRLDMSGEWPKPIEVTQEVRQALRARLTQNRRTSFAEAIARRARLKPEPEPEPNRIPPTKQTKEHAKRNRDSIQVMHERGAIGAEEVRAALEIRQVYHAIVGGLFPRAHDPSGIGVRGAPRPDWSPAMTAAYERYCAWAKELSDRLSLGGPPILEICVDAIVDGMTCAEIDQARRWRKGRAADLIREGLERYAVRAGWRVSIAA